MVRHVKALAPIALLALSACATAGPPGEIRRAYATPAAAIARSIVIPPGYETIRLSGMVADPVTPAANGQPASYGDTETQAESILRKIAAALSEVGAGEGDVVAMTVYLVAPSPGQPMDFAGMMRAYSRHYGSAAQPNRPVRSTVQVAALAGSGLLVEIEVTAARRP
jgi:enamine deaminase RidA (YjgF/YER057c/UK114 family)